VRVLAACSLGGAGHLGPLLPFLGAARRRGDTVLVTGPAALTDMVERAGFSFVPGGEPAEAEVAPIRERLPVVPHAEAVILGNRELFGRLAARAMLPTIEQVVADWIPDVVLRDPCEYASAVVAHRRGIMAAQVAISLAEAEWNSIDAAAPALEEHRRGLADEVRTDPYLSRFPASLDPSAFPVTVRVQERPLRPPAPLPNWWAGSDAPFVYMTFGTVLGYMSVAGEVYRAALDAAEGIEARVLLTLGHRLDRMQLGAIPTNVRVEGWVDQSDVMPHADLVVCHGGSGTTLGALAAGVPLVMVPVFADQFENARRVTGARAGLTVRANAVSHQGDGVIGPSDAPRIARAVATVLAEPSFQRSADRIAAEMAASMTVDDALSALVER
jgi:UDP:flavonoid glycosyltransferase YjiC (YdhE family)